MSTLIFLAAVGLLGSAPAKVPSHESNPVYRTMVDKGITIAGKSLKFPEPRVRDGLSADEQRGLLREIAGSERAVDELVRRSVTAPFVLRLRNDTTGQGDLIRGGDLWFVIHADLDAIDPAEFARRSSDGRPVEAGNMRFTGKLLEPSQLEARKLEVAGKPEEAHEWFAHLSGRLLDRIQVEETDHSTASRSAESWIIAARTDDRFAKDADFPNRWSAITPDGTVKGELHPYSGGASYVKITRLSAVSGALLVEVHFAFAEPRAWFDGAPILRSKISLIAQDRIRALRRELAKSRTEPDARKESDRREDAPK
jgi:hypothetical protein